MLGLTERVQRRDGERRIAAKVFQDVTFPELVVDGRRKLTPEIGAFVDSRRGMANMVCRVFIPRWRSDNTVLAFSFKWSALPRSQIASETVSPVIFAPRNPSLSLSSG